MALATDDQAMVRNWLAVCYPNRPENVICDVVAKFSDMADPWIQFPEVATECCGAVLEELSVEQLANTPAADTVLDGIVRAQTSAAANRIELDLLAQLVEEDVRGDFGSDAAQYSRPADPESTKALMVFAKKTLAGLTNRRRDSLRSILKGLVGAFVFGQTTPVLSLEPGHSALLQPHDKRILDRVEVGDTIYPLVNPVEGIARRREASMEFALRTSQLGIVGRGDTVADALRDWQIQVHVAFQRLFRKRPREMNESEKETWSALQRLIDVAGYAANMPLIRRKIGRIRRTCPQPLEVEWLDEGAEAVELSVVPAEFVSLVTDQWFEAVVQRDRTTRRLQKILFFQPIEPLRPKTPEQLATFLDKLPREQGAPTPRQDWTRF